MIDTFWNILQIGFLSIAILFVWGFLALLVKEITMKLLGR